MVEEYVEPSDQEKQSWLNLVFNRHNLNRPNSVGELVNQLALLAPRSQQEWEELYFENVKSRIEIEAVAARLIEKVERAVDVLKSITLEDCRAYLPRVVIQDTYEGYVARREEVLKIIREQTDLDFAFLLDQPQDWSPRDFKIDIGVFLDCGYWLCIKLLPASFRKMIGTLQGAAALNEINRAHEEFRDRWGEALTEYYDKNASGDSVLEDQAGTLERIAKAIETLRERPD